MTRRAEKLREEPRRVSDDYTLDYFAAKHGIPKTDALRILTLHRGDRDSCDRAAHRLKG